MRRIGVPGQFLSVCVLSHYAKTSRKTVFPYQCVVREYSGTNCLRAILKTETQSEVRCPTQQTVVASTSAETAKKISSSTNTPNAQIVSPDTQLVGLHRAAEWRRLVFSSWQRGLFTALGTATGIGVLVFFLATPMKADTVQQTAQIASQALEDERLKETATRLTRDVVEQILTDERSVVLLAEVIQTLLKKDASKIAVTSFIRDIFEDKYTQEVTKKFVLKVVSDPWVMDQLHHILFSLVDDLLKDPETKAILREVLVASSVDALRDEAFQAQAGRTVRSIVWQTIWNSGGQTGQQQQAGVDTGKTAAAK